MKHNRPIKFCSTNCQHKDKIKGITKPCSNCGRDVYRKQSEIKKNQSNKIFCNNSCSATYHNEHKTHGYRRSKLEKYLENKLIELYPNLEFHFNRKDTINSELDIYIPSLKLAFELNGIFHYEPIFGQEKLDKTQNNDKRKFQACLEKGVELCIIDSSKLSYFKERTAKPYLDIIVNLIQNKLN